MLDRCTVNFSITTQIISWTMLENCMQNYVLEMGQFIRRLRGNGATPMYEAKEFPSTYIFRRIFLRCKNIYVVHGHICVHMLNYSRARAYSQSMIEITPRFEFKRTRNGVLHDRKKCALCILCVNRDRLRKHCYSDINNLSEQISPI